MASFLITLVLILPFYTANVYAILDVTVTNSDNVEDFDAGGVVGGCLQDL